MGGLRRKGEGALAGGDEELGGWGEEVGEVVDGADVVDVGVGEEDAADETVATAGGFDDGLGEVGEVGIDEGEAVGLADEVAVD